MCSLHGTETGRENSPAKKSAKKSFSKRSVWISTLMFETSGVFSPGPQAINSRGNAKIRTVFLNMNLLVLREFHHLVSIEKVFHPVKDQS